ncbi:ribose-phosphate diphosphokinase, partial [Gemmatimonadota bacterium]
DIPSDHLYSVPIFIQYFKSLKLKDMVVVCPDIGGAKMARGFAGRLNAPMAFIEKRRPKPNVAITMNVIGDVADKNVIMVDDIIDTGGTLVAACEALAKRNPKSIHVGCTHAILSGEAPKLLQNSPITRIAVTDSVFIPKDKIFPKLKILSVDKLLGKAISYIHEGRSVSSLFD